MTKEQFVKRIDEVVPDGATIEWSEITILTKDFITLNQDTESDMIIRPNDVN